MPSVERDGELVGLASMIADLIEGNIATDPGRARLLEGPIRSITITAVDLDTSVGIRLGRGKARVSGTREPQPHLWIRTDAVTLLDLPNARLMGGLPSVADPIGRAVTRKMLTGKLKIKGMFRLGLLIRLQRLLSVA